MRKSRPETDKDDAGIEFRGADPSDLHAIAREARISISLPITNSMKIAMRTRAVVGPAAAF